MSTRTVSVIVHGHEWPEPSWAQALRAVLAVPPGAGPGSVIEVLDARESATDARGAAHAINRVAEAASGDLLIVVEAGCTWDKRGLADLGTAVSHGDVLAVIAPGPEAEYLAGPESPRSQPWNDAWVPSAIASRTELTALVEHATSIALEDWTRQLSAARPRLWAIRRPTFRALGGLDTAFWSVGLVEDLADRARGRGIALSVTSGAPASASPHDAWPLKPAVRQLLALRNTLLSAARTQPPAAAGRTFAVTAALAFADAWRQAAIPADRLQFGGTWGATRRAPRKRGDSADPGSVWPAAEGATLVPILALDSFLETIVTRVTDPAHVRRSWPEQPSPDLPGDGHETATATPAAGPVRPATVPPDEAAAAAADDRVAHDAALPFVSVIVVNWNGREHLETCFDSLAASDYPADRFELVCVDNGSTDGSRDLLAARFPQVRVVALAENRGFTGGNNAGVAEARGQVLAFFNNDMRVETGTLRALVSALGPDHPCAAAQVRSWNARSIDFVAGTANFEARGFQDHYGEPWSAERAAAVETFFPNGGAFAITRDAYDAAGGFDDHFFAYYDDVDLGFGVRAQGGGIRVVREATAFHRHGATSDRHPSGQKRFLMERNAIWTVIKRYENASLDRSLGAVLLLAARRIAQATTLHHGLRLTEALAPFTSRCRSRTSVSPTSAAAVYEFQPPPGGVHAMLQEDRSAALVRSMPVESLAAVGEALGGLPAMIERRRACQAGRRVPDRVVFTSLGRPLAYVSTLASYQAAQDALVEILDLAEVFRSRPRLLLITHEPFRRRMSGPGLRVLELGRTLARTVRVTIATPAPPEIADDRCAIAPYSAESPATLRRLAEDADVLLVQGFTLTQFPFLTSMHVPIVVDLYCPFSVEFLEMKTAEAKAQGAEAPDIDVQFEAISVLEVQNAQLRHGDFFIAASERQRDFWLGALHSAQRVNAQTYAADATLRTLVDVVPFGVPEGSFDEAVQAARAAAGERVLKGARPGIAPTDRVLFWGGSLLDWQDPLTLIRAVARLSRTRSDVKLFFAGTRHPNPQVAPMRVVEAAQTLARDLDVLDRFVFFNDWIAYDERAAYLHEADLGLSTHRLHLETHLSFRTRMLDYIWAGLPIVCTEGDYFADLVRTRGLGLVVPPDDEEALAAAIARLLDDRGLWASSRVALARVREELRWGRVTEPLRRFVAAPHFAADREPAIRAVRAKLRDSYRLSRWVKRTALKLGVSESSFEQLKLVPAVRTAMRLRNQVALRRAGQVRL